MTNPVEGNSQTLTIDLGKFGGPVYVGRDRGERARKKLNLDQADSISQKLSILIPNETFSVNSSFLLGLLGPTIQHSGSDKAFSELVAFQASDEAWEAYLSDAIREAVHFVLSNPRTLD